MPLSTVPEASMSSISRRLMLEMSEFLSEKSM